MYKLNYFYSYYTNRCVYIVICYELRINNNPYIKQQQQMQKYRKWTDEATGINPFIDSRHTTVKLTTIITTAIITVVKINIIALLIFPICFSLCLQDYLGNIPVVGALVAIPLNILTLLLGLWGVDDSNFSNWVQKTRGKGKLILSNSLCILDPFYYMSKIPGVKFIVSSYDEDNFEIVSGFSAVTRILTNRQPFFNPVSSPNGLKFKKLVEAQTKLGHTCVLFYEGIRTNGLGTIKISKKLSQQVFNLEQDYCVAHLKYPSAPPSLFSSTMHPIILFLMALGSWSISLKVRCMPVTILTQHSQADVQKDVDNFLLANAAKLLQTEPISYFRFLQFYNKTQAGAYTQVSQQDKSD